MAGNRWTRRGAASSRSVLTALVLVGGVSLVGCSAGQQAQTAEQRPTVNGANVNLGALAIRNAELEYPPDGVYEEGSDARLHMAVVNEAPSSDTLVEVRTDAAESVTIAAAEEGAGPTPTLTAPPPSETASGTGEPTATPSPSITADPADPSASGSPSGSASPASPTPSATPGEAGSARIQIPTNGLVSFREDGPTILLTGLTEPLRPAQRLTVTLVFRNAGEVEVPLAVAVPKEEISTAPTIEGHSEE